MLTTTQLRAAWNPPCKLQGGVTLTLNGDGRVYVDGRTADAVRALNRCLDVFGYRTRRKDTGAYNCRQITAGKGHSLHSYGIALDLNWTSNGYRSTNDGILDTDMPAAMVGAILAIRTVNGRQVWGWGGNYRSIEDPMHYEIVCRPADLATGIDWRTVPALGPVPVDVSWVPLVVVPQASRATENGRRVQRALNLLRPYTGAPALKVDGIVGSKTIDAVRRLQTFGRTMQRMAGQTDPRKLLAVDGVWGPSTGSTARFWLPAAVSR